MPFSTSTPEIRPDLDAGHPHGLALARLAPPGRSGARPRCAWAPPRRAGSGRPAALRMYDRDGGRRPRSGRGRPGSSRQCLRIASLTAHLRVGRVEGGPARRRPGWAGPGSRTPRRAGAPAACWGRRRGRLDAPGGRGSTGSRPGRGRPGVLASFTRLSPAARRSCGGSGCAPAGRSCPPRCSGSRDSMNGTSTWFVHEDSARSCASSRHQRACSASRGSARPGAGRRTAPAARPAARGRCACAIHGIAASSVGAVERTPGSASREKARSVGSASFELAERRVADAQGVAQRRHRRGERRVLARERARGRVEVGDQVLQRLRVVRRARPTRAAGRAAARGGRVVGCTPSSASLVSARSAVGRLEVRDRAVERLRPAARRAPSCRTRCSSVWRSPRVSRVEHGQDVAAATPPWPSA